MADAVTITGKPDAVPGSVAVGRSKNTYAVGWKVGAGAKSESNAKRAQGVEAVLKVAGKKKNKKGDWVSASATIVDRKFGLAAKKMTTLYQKDGRTQNHFDRSLYYPFHNLKLTSMTGYVRYYNSKGSGAWGKKIWEYSAPAKPTLGTPSFSGNTVSFPISVPAATGKAERYCVEYQLLREANYTSSGADKNASSEVVKQRTMSTGDAIWKGSVAKESSTVTYTDGAFFAMTKQSHYVKYTLRARSRGLAGDNAGGWIEKSVTYRFATKPIVVDENGNQTYSCLLNPDTGQYDIVTVFFSFGGEPYLRGVRLQYQCSESQPGGDGWQNVADASGSKNCRSLNVSANLLTPAIGEYVWLRVVAEYEGDNHEQPSDPVCIKELYRAYDTAEALKENLGIVSKGSSSMDTLTVGIGWNNDSYNGTEISWSKDGNAWRSTKEPDSFQMPDDMWREAGGTYVDDQGGQITYDNSTTVTIMGLDEATLYYVRVRRFDTEDDRNRSGWTKTTSAVTGAAAIGCNASVPSVVPLGSPVPVSWAVGGAQDSWDVLVSLDGQEFETAVSGSGEATSATIPAEFDWGEFDAAKNVLVKVVSTRGTNATESSAVNLTIAKVPNATISAAPTITAKPFDYQVSCDQDATIRTWIEAVGVSNALPDGREEQWSGDVIYSQLVTVGAGAQASVTVPADARFVDGAEYRFRATPYTAFLQGDTVTASYTTTEEDEEGTETVAHEEFPVAWAHQAVAPSECAVVVDAEAMSVTVTPSVPSGYADGDSFAAEDVFDLYRVTADGAQLIAAGVQYGNSVRDRWAPFGEDVDLSYRIATRTVDGDVDWADFAYALRADYLRFDWDGKSVELPYNVRLKDKFKKSFKARSYLDGTVGGYWNEATERSSSFDTAFIKITDQGALRLVRELAQYAGAVFVRTPDGAAFEANVSVDEISSLASSLVGEASFSATEIECETYVCSADDIQAVG